MNLRTVLILMAAMLVAACNRGPGETGDEKPAANPIRDYIATPKDRAEASGRAVEERRQRLDAAARELQD